jgi:hypothetical protein
MNIILKDVVTKLEPEVGMGATVVMWSDRHAATIIEVSKDKKSVVIQEDNVDRIDNRGMCDWQEYSYSRNPNVKKQTYTLRKNKRWVCKGEPMKNGTGILINVRDHYYDYSF